MIQVYGIRHHGPGSARSVLRALEDLQPDAILVEGPPDAAEVLPLLAHEEMQPPVAILVYARDEPKRSAFYPFAEFSPEWQALRFGLGRQIPVRFMDLPVAHRFALEPAEPMPASTDDSPTPELAPAPEETTEIEVTVEISPREDPLRWLAEAAGYSDGERWWEQMVEHRRDAAGVFEAVLHAMTALREELPEPADSERTRLEMLREAWMRQTIRAAQREGFERIAVVCGAWHAPALASLPPARADAELLKGLPKLAVQATWVPWTNGRLCFESGYGAGVESPGWYHHLWKHPQEPGLHWMTRVARLLRAEDLDASSAHVIEAIRLADSLAALRDRPLPGLPEMNEAAQTVLCFGSELPMRLIRERLIVGETLGAIPEETPSVPLQQDLQRLQKRLRMTPEAGVKELDLDLRKENDRERSQLLHRLGLLGIYWGEPQRAMGKGTFHEVWRLQWKPEFAVAVIEVGVWGNSVLDAATASTIDTAERADSLPLLTALLERALNAEIPVATSRLMQRIESESAVASDLGHLMDALPPLANVLRYGDVRRTDPGAVRHVVHGLAARIQVGLVPACASLNDDAAEAMHSRVNAVQGACGVLQDPDITAGWTAALQRLIDHPGVHGLVAGRACRILLDTRAMAPEEASTRLGLALTTAVQPASAATWAEGFLRGSGAVLLHDPTLWAVLDGWVGRMRPESFTELLPLLRRTFSTFPAGERRSIGERARSGPARIAAGPATDELDHERAAEILPLLARILGLPLPTSNY